MTGQRKSDRTATQQVINAMRIIRKRQGITCERLSELLNARGQMLSRGSLSNQELGYANHITIDQVVALADVFGVPLERLLETVCDTCQGFPPAGFTCNDCGATGVRAEAS
jgi:transcriptional regulator with XRE-family HTH domain